MPSCARYGKEGVGSSRPNWRWILCFLEGPKAHTSGNACAYPEACRTLPGRRCQRPGTPRARLPVDAPPGMQAGCFSAGAVGRDACRDAAQPGGAGARFGVRPRRQAAWSTGSSLPATSSPAYTPRQAHAVSGPGPEPASANAGRRRAERARALPLPMCWRRGTVWVGGSSPTPGHSPPSPPPHRRLGCGWGRASRDGGHRSRRRAGHACRPAWSECCGGARACVRHDKGPGRQRPTSPCPRAPPP